jgi:hypothetical protein
MTAGSSIVAMSCIRPEAIRSGATLRALEHEGRSAASHAALSRQAHAAAMRRRIAPKKG